MSPGAPPLSHHTGQQCVVMAAFSLPIAKPAGTARGESHEGEEEKQGVGEKSRKECAFTAVSSAPAH